MGSEGLVAAILLGSFGLIFALVVVLRVSIIRTFGPVVVVSRDTARVGFLFIGMVSFVVVVSLSV